MTTLGIFSAVIAGIITFLLLWRVAIIVLSFWEGYSNHRKKPTLSEKAYRRGKYLALDKNIDDKYKEGNK